VISDAEAEAFLGSLSAAVLQDLAGLAFPGSNTAMAIAPCAARIFCRVLERYSIGAIPALFDALTRIPFTRAFAVVETQAARSDLDEDLKREVVKYLSAIPMTSRQALHRFDDGGHVTTLVSQVPRTMEEIARLMPARTPLFQPGDRVPGYDYRLEMLLGQGGFAEVWEASHTELKGQPPVALKFCLDKALVPSLRREIEIVSVLQDRASDKDIVRLLGTAYNADPPFLIYEYVDGGNLCGWLDSFKGAAPSPKDVIAILKMTARAVAIAHDRSIAHCDLKPANLLMTREGRVKVGDFGIGRVVAADRDGKDGARPDGAGLAGVGSSQESMTAPLQQAYTPVYSDPLRDRAMPAGPPDDVYAMGVIGYQLLVGNARARMEGGWRRYMERRGVPGDLVAIIDTCVAPPGERYVNAGALLAALEHCGKPAKASAEKLRAGAKPQAAVKFCHRCGRRSPAEKRFCSNCGYGFPG
jgi:Protein kinase domain